MTKKGLVQIIGGIILVVAMIGLPACEAQTPTPKTPPTYGLIFDGVDDYVALGNATVLGFTSGDFTIEAWIRPANVTRRMRVFIRGSWNKDGYRLDVAPKGKLEFYTFQSNATQVTNTSANVLAVGNWSHIAVVRQGASVRIYVNGEDKTGTAGSHLDPAYVAARNAMIGTNYEPEVYHGIISEVRVWNSARSQSQIEAGMYRKFTGSEAGLVGYWKLNEGSGTVARDSTANNNHGTLYGNPVWFTGGS